MAVGESNGPSQSRYGSVGRSASSADVASWEDADPEELWRTVTAIVNAGDAVTLGRTLDGGALSLVILSGRDRLKHYAHGEEELKTLLSEIRIALESTD